MRKTERTFQREWLEEIRSTIETLITDPTNKQRVVFLDLIPQYLHVVRTNLHPENKERLEETERRYQDLHDSPAL